MAGFSVLIVGLFAALAASAASIVGGTAILPKNIRAFIYQYRHYDVDSRFTPTGAGENLDMSIGLRLGDVMALQPSAKTLVRDLDAADRKILEDAGLMNMSFKPDVNLNVHVLGLGWGLRDRLMLGVGLPIFEAEVKITGRFQMDRAALRRVAEKFRQKSYTADEIERPRLQAIIAVLESIPDIEGAHIQSYVVNELGYEPIGDWRGSGIGDLRVFLHYNYLARPESRHGLRFGTIAPTGRVDDPDLLTDFAVGSGVWSNFIESRHDFFVAKKTTLSAQAGYEHAWPATREVRVPTTGLDVSAVKENTDFQRGDILDLRVGAGYEFRPALEAFYQHEWHREFDDDYRGRGDSRYYKALGDGSGERTHAHVYGLSYSTVAGYRRGDFSVPMQASLVQTTQLDGASADRLDYTALEVQVYF